MRDPRFPIGKLELQKSYSSAERGAWIENLERLPGRLREAVAGLSDSGFQLR